MFGRVLRSASAKKNPYGASSTAHLARGRVESSCGSAASSRKRLAGSMAWSLSSSLSKIESRMQWAAPPYTLGATLQLEVKRLDS